MDVVDVVFSTRWTELATTASDSLLTADTRDYDDHTRRSDDDGDR